MKKKRQASARGRSCNHTNTSSKQNIAVNSNKSPDAMNTMIAKSPSEQKKSKTPGKSKKKNTKILQEVPGQIKLNKVNKGKNKISYVVAEKVAIDDRVADRINGKWREYEDKIEELKKIINDYYTRPELNHLKKSYNFSKMFPKTYDIHRMLLNVALNVGPKYEKSDVHGIQ